MSAPKMPPRSAEEIAREMVPDPDRIGLVWYTLLTRSDGGICSSCYSDLGSAAQVRDATVAHIIRLIEQARADGAAMERAAQDERTKARIRDDWKVPAIDHYREGLHRIWRGEPNPQAIACSYLGEDGPSQPRDLAGRIRALVLKYTNRFLDASERAAYSGDCDEAYAISTVVIEALRAAYLDAIMGEDLAARIDRLRAGPTCSLDTRTLLNEAADELEAVVRECTPQESR